MSTVLTHQDVVGNRLKRTDLLEPSISNFLLVDIVVVPDHLQAEDAVGQDLSVKLQKDFVYGSHSNALYGLDLGVRQRRMKETRGVLLQTTERDGDKTDVGIELLAI